MPKPRITPHDAIDDPRRAFLLRALAAGLLAGGAGWRSNALASVLGRLPGKLPEGRSVFEQKGEVTINGAAAGSDSIVRAGDVVRTGKGAHLIAVVGQDALLLRSDTELQIAPARAARSFFRVVTGAMLAVFGRRNDSFDITTPTATIGIRGTGVYTEVDPEKSYICTCYGETRITAADDPAASELIRARHHDAPRYVLAKPHNGRRIVPAMFAYHTDLELMTLEALVGREVPFEVGEGQYLGPRREY